VNIQHARQFLEWLGHCNLIAATPNWEEHFAPPPDQDIYEWIETTNDKGYNIYFSVNPTRAVGKGTKDDVIEARYVHCDVDDPERVNQSAQIAAQQEVSCVFRSGRGIGILVRLTTPTRDFQQVELINRKLIVGYGGDRGTHNIDRILKLPGTTAWMSSKKKLAGAVDGPTYVEHWLNDSASVEEMLAMLKDIDVVIRPKVIKLTHSNATEEQIMLRLRSEGQWDINGADASSQLAKMLRIATKLSTNEAQVKDIILSSPYAINGPATAKETRAEKIERVWQNEWFKAVQDTEPHRAKIKESSRNTPVNNDIPRAATPNIYSRPIGLLGDMYDFFLGHAVAPNPIFALAGAKTMLAGIIGRQYQISGNGIQFYNLVLAASGTGKQSATNGIRAIENSLRRALPTLWDRHSGPTMLASAPGMQTLLKEKPACYAVINEYGATLDAITHQRSNETTKRLKGALLDLYTASSPGSIFGAAWYSDKEKKKDPVISPAFTFLGDAVAEDFRQIVTDENVKDGLLPRHSLYVYDDFPPPANRNRLDAPPESLIQTLGKIIVHIQELEVKDEFIQIPIYSTSIASDLHDRYSEQKAKEIGRSDPTLPIYQRVAHKILREAALAAFSRWAVGMSDLMVTEDDIALAEAFVSHQSEYMVKSMMGGFGRGSNARETMVMDAIKGWSRAPIKHKKTYRAPSYTHDRKDIIPQLYVVEKLKRSKHFQPDDRTNSAELVRKTIEELVIQGQLHELTPEQVLTEFPTELVRAPMYRLIGT
jgi:hypothetical protein